MEKEQMIETEDGGRYRATGKSLSIKKIVKPTPLSAGVSVTTRIIKHQNNTPHSGVKHQAGGTYYYSSEATKIKAVDNWCDAINTFIGYC